MTRFALAAATCGLLLFASVGTAHATEADRLFQLGRRASEMGKFGTACSLFRESYRLEPAVGTLLNLGDCEEQQNHVSAALDYYQDALSRLSVTDDRMGPLRVRIEALEQRSGKLEIKLGDGAPQDSKILIDGEPVPPEKLKGPLTLSAGGHLLQVTAIGYRGSRQTVDLTAGQKKDLTVWPGPQLEVNELALATDDRAREEKRESRSRTLRYVGFGAAGLGVASLWVGSIAGFFALDRESTRHDHCNADNACDPVGLDAARSGKTFATVSTVTLAAGAVLAAGGVYLILTEPDRTAKTTSRAVVPPTALGAVPSPRGASLSLRAAF